MLFMGLRVDDGSLGRTDRSCDNGRLNLRKLRLVRAVLTRTAMRSPPTPIVATFLAVVVACSAESDSWPETIQTTAKWPRYGQRSVESPSWLRPRQFGCAVRVKVRTEPERDFAAGESRRVVYGDEVSRQCATVGAHVRVVDAGADKRALIHGNCQEGYGMAVGGERLAALVFGDASACEAYAKVRSAAPEWTTTELRLVAVQPIATFAFVKADATFGVEAGVEDVP